MSQQLATIGYEGAALPDFIAALLRAGVERVVDVRQIAQSRKAGFSKNAFRKALAENGIEYYHLRQLGDPKLGREAARAGHFDLFKAIFSAHLDLPTSQEALREAVLLATQKLSALVCYENDPTHCHRTIVASRMAHLRSFKITNLAVRPRCGQEIRQNAASTDRLVGAC